MTKSLTLAVGLIGALALACGAAVNTVDWGHLSASNIVTGELLVGFNSVKALGKGQPVALAARAKAHSAVGAAVLHSFRSIPVDQVRLPVGITLEAAAQRYAADPNVAYVAPNYRRYADATTPNDPDFSDQWGMQRIHAPEAWDRSVGSTSVVVAVIDTGVYYPHEDLSQNAWRNLGEDWVTNYFGQLVPGNNGLDNDGNGYTNDYWGWDFFSNDNDPMDEDGHGTHCAGVIGAVGNNGIGVAGINWNVKIMALRFLGPDGGSDADAIKCIEYATNPLLANRPRVLSNSWGGETNNPALQAAIDSARSNGVLFVAAAGNNSTNNDAKPYYPSSYPSPNLISVASINQSGTLSDLSNYGLKSVDIAAPGDGILSTYGFFFYYGYGYEGYATLSGTSIATPHVAGAAAMLWAINPGLSMASVRKILLTTARTNASLLGKVVTSGELDLLAAIDEVSFSVTPRTPMTFIGDPAGPFEPTSFTTTLTNGYAARGAIDWTASTLQSWLDLSVTSGTLATGASTTVDSGPNAVAATLPLGLYTGAVAFADITNTSRTDRAVWLTVAYSNYWLRSTPYTWIDPVAALHKEISFAENGMSSALQLPFDFSFYRKTCAHLYVSSSGIVSFDGSPSAGTTSNNSVSIAGPPFAMLAAYWGAIDGYMPPGHVYFGTSGSGTGQVFVITWMDATSLSDYTHQFAFQVVIPQRIGTADNDLIVQYQNVEQDNAQVGAGRRATIGTRDWSDGARWTEYSTNGAVLLADGMGLKFTEFPWPETNAPTPTIRQYRDQDVSLQLELRFDELVSGTIAPANFLVSGTLSNAVVTSVTGSGLRFLVNVSGWAFGEYGALTVSLPAGVVTDLSGNSNRESNAYLYVRPFHDTVFSDDMEHGPSQWVTSGSNNLSQIILDAWQLGVPTSPYGPGTARSPINCWGAKLTSACPNNVWSTLESPPIAVGDAPVLQYATWYNFHFVVSTDWVFVTNTFVQVATTNFYGSGYVEVFNGAGWYDVTPNGRGMYWGSSGGWSVNSISLDPALFGNRNLRVRFRAVTGESSVPQGGMFVDDVRVFSRRSPGVWVTEFAPTSGVPSSVTSLWFTAYNSTTATLHGVTASVATPDAGLVLTGSVAYGDMAPGAIVSGSTSVWATFGPPGGFLSTNVSLFHSVMSLEGVANQQTLAYQILGGASIAGTNRLWVKLASDAAGVVDWMGRRMMGDGGPASSLFQAISAGTNGVSDPPGPGGQVTGDDRILYEYGGVAGYGRFGTGGVEADVGLFLKAFMCNLTAGSNVYIRAWSAASMDASVAYGDSTNKLITAAAIQTNAYPSWIVRTPVNYTRDSNGDGVPDGWCVLSGLDPLLGRVALSNAWTTNGIATQASGWPNRVAVWSNYVYVTQGADDMGGPTAAGQVSIWTRDLTNRLGTFGSFGSGTNQFNAPRGLAVHPSSNLLAVADTKNNRIVVLAITPTNGALTWLFSFGGSEFGTANYLWKPQGVGIATDGYFWVADTMNNALRKFNPNGVYQGAIGGLGLTLPQAVAVDTNNLTYVADTGNNRVRILDSAHNPITNLTGGVGKPLSSPSDVQIGVGGRIYVADLDNSRVQVFGADYLYQGAFGSYGSGDGQLHTPRGLWPVKDDGLLYVADTWNNRVVRMRTVLDFDGDGMDDIWEDLHNAHDPNGDPDGDGVTNLGEYRAGTDPNKIDTNGNGASDLWDMLHMIDPAGPAAPLSNAPPHLVAVTCEPTGRPVVYGETVRLTATFTKAMSATPLPNLALNGGATLPATPMTVQTATNAFRLDYAVQTNDEGAVNAVIAGAQDMTGLYLDPATSTVTGVFTVTSEVIRITAVMPLPYVLNWSAISSFVYQVQTVPLLPTTNWDYVSTWTSAVNGVMAAPVAGPVTNGKIFYRVQREKPPW